MADKNRMIARHMPKGGLDDFPTPHWATRALLDCVLDRHHHGQIGEGRTVWEPACGRGYMADVLKERADVLASDVKDYGYKDAYEFDFVKGERLLMPESEENPIIITNPPFNHSLPFVKQALEISDTVCIFQRIQFVEGIKRYLNLYKNNKPRTISIFCERVGIVEGRLDKDAPAMMTYAWFVWNKHNEQNPEFTWIEPGTKDRLMKPEDWR